MLFQARELEGILLIDKPRDHTSHDVVARLRGKLKMKRIGHAGTLDPMATGLLVILVGKATKVSQYLVSLDKEYEGTIELGKVTDTQDAEGEVMATKPVPVLTEDDVQATIKSFLGDQYQLPPMYSAIKIAGQPLYKAARKGEEVAREPRFIRVMSWDLLRFASPQIDFRLRCTKGTYVRTLAFDLGRKLGPGAHLSMLRRTRSGQLDLTRGHTLPQLGAMNDDQLLAALVPVSEAAPAA